MLSGLMPAVCMAGMPTCQSFSGFRSLGTKGRHRQALALRPDFQAFESTAENQTPCFSYVV